MSLDNGSVVGGSVSAVPLTFEGYASAPGQLAIVQMLGASTGASQGTAYGLAGSSPDPLFPSSPLFRWSGVATPAYWPQGGLLRIRGGTMFDQSVTACFAASGATTPSAFVGSCQTPYGNGTEAILVSSDPTPADTFTGLTAQRYLGSIQQSAAETQQYYDKIGAGPGAPLSTLAGFKSHFGFGNPGGDEVTALYYNEGDLGLGRLMTCRSFPVLAWLEYDGTRFRKVYDNGHACYVTNFGKDAAGKAAFGGALPSTTALSQAVTGYDSPAIADPIATVAMVYQPCTILSPCAAGHINFIVYAGANDPSSTPQGNTLLSATLDDHGSSFGSNESIPGNCLACHGAGNAGYDPSTHTITGSPQFLPFDVQSFRYSSDPRFTRAAQEGVFRSLNAHVYGSGPSPAIAELLEGMYKSASGPGPSSSPTADDTFVPAGWQGSRASKALYEEVVKPYCRTCHVSRNDSRAWQTFASFTGAAQTIKYKVCDPHVHQMPNAVQTQRKFWRSPARAHLVQGLGLSTDCDPF
jgi:hypothetical protein